MVAEVVPIARIRRDTTTWSYRLPKGSLCSVGSLVTISLHGRPSLGVVWNLLDQDERATSEAQVLTSYALILPQHRAVIEQLALVGLTSLATALYYWSPAAFRKPTLQPWALELLRLTPLSEPPPQQMILTPQDRSDLSVAVVKMGRRGRILLGDTTPRNQLTDWMAIRRGEISVGYGRERALFAPWCNLSKVAIYQPEHISYYTTQAPYLNLVETAIVTARAWNTFPSLRSSLPNEATYTYWQLPLPATESIPEPPSTRIHWVSLEHEPIVSALVVSMTKTALASHQSVLIIHNAHDRLITKTEKGEKVQKKTIGIEQAAKDIATALGLPALPSSVCIGTRSLLYEHHHNLGLIIYLSADHFLQSPLLSDSLHGWSDLCWMLHKEVPVIVQARKLDDPGLTALREGTLPDYLRKRILDQADSQLPPFGTTYLLSYTDQAILEEVVSNIVLPEPWQMSQVNTFLLSGTKIQGFFMHHPATQASLPGPVRSQIMKLERPWKVMHNPWFLS